MPRIGGSRIGGDHSWTHENGGPDEISIADLSGIPEALATHEADIDVHMRDLLQLLRVGNYHAFLPLKTTRIDTSGPGAGLIYAFPFVIARPLTLDRIAVHITTSHAGNNYRLGIYEDNGEGYPGDLLLDAGTISTAATGVKAITIDQALSRGVYHWAIHSSSSTAKVTGYNPAFWLLGLPATDFQETWRCGTYLSRAYASGFPDPFGTPTGEITTALCLFGRLASLD